jgi:hypothetical protein
MELNHHSSRGAFTTPWARQCPAYPCAAVSDHCRLELAEGEGVEPSTQRSARLSRPVAHHCAPPSVLCHGCPSALQRATPAFEEQRFSLSAGIVRPGVLEPPTALQSGAYDGYKPSALPIELWAQAQYLRASTIFVKWSGRLDSNQRPPASKAGALAWLSYTLLFLKLALRREIESLSPDRQSGRLTRCVTEPDA